LQTNYSLDIGTSKNNGGTGADDLHLAEDGRGIAKFRADAKKTKQKIDGRGGAG
jgi:hypothetical protein